MTLIAVYDNNGCVGRCDASCHEATHPHCTCICGGKNHGVGLQKAMDNTRELVEQWIETYRQKPENKDKTIEVNPLLNQLTLF